jgi:hypothetical protein
MRRRLLIRVWAESGKSEERIKKPRLLNLVSLLLLLLLLRRWEDNIKMDLQEVGGGCGNWMELAQGRDRCWVCTCEYGKEPSGSIKMM